MVGLKSPSWIFRKWRELEQRIRCARPDPRRELCRGAEQAVMERLAGMGHLVRPTHGNARYDLLVDHAARVEVKASLYYPAAGHRGGRYQAHFHNEADLLVFCCVNGSRHFFVIPTADLDGRRNIAVWSEDPARYLGQWRRYYEAWDRVAQVVKTATIEGVYQLPLWRTCLAPGAGQN